MDKRNKLHTINKWNKPAFMPVNRFDLGENTNPFGVKPLSPPFTQKINWSNTVQTRMALGQTKSLVDNFSKNTPNLFQGTNNSGGTNRNNSSSGNASLGFGSDVTNALMVGLANPVGDMVGNAIGGGLHSGAGDAIGNLGGIAGSAIGTVNPVLGAAVTVGSKLVGGVTNALWGTKTDAKKKAANDAGTNYYNSFQSNAGSFDDIQGPIAQAAVQNAHKGGLFKKGWASRENQKDKEKRIEARQGAFRAVDNNIENLKDDQMNEALASYYAFGGPLDTILDNSDMGAVNYGFMSDYLLQKKKQAASSNKVAGISPMPVFALGGDIQTHGSDFTDGLVFINAGGSHETNPYDGVQVGLDNEGTPNLVEEGETIFNDYVYSTRIMADEETKKKFRLPLKKDISFADISKKLEKEASERPNDNISQAGLKAMMAELAEQQERQKQEMEAERAREAFAALSPKEQAAVMQQMAQQEQMAQQQAEESAMQEMTMPEGQMEQQPMMADGSEASLGQMPNMNAYGGKVNRFDTGGLKERLYKAMGWHTDRDFYNWANKNKLNGHDKWGQDGDNFAEAMSTDENWLKFIQGDNFKEAIKDNPALFDAISKGYDFGMYSPEAGAISFDDDRGNWDNQTVQGWWDSNDPAWKEVISKHPELTKDTQLTKEQLADYIRNTDAFQKGTKWLEESEDNRLAYLQRIINNPNAPKKAKEYAMKFVDANGWKDKAARDYTTIFDNPSGRSANPGTYWKTPIEAVRGIQTGNFVINADGSIEPIIGDVPTDWTSAGNYSWDSPETSYAYNYYRMPEIAKEDADVQNGNTDNNNTNDNNPDKTPHYNKLEGLRYAGLLGPAVGLGMMAAGVGRPDTSILDAAIANSGNVALAGYQPIGNYLTYRPMDIWYEQNRLNAASRATARNIINTSGGNRGTAMAGLLANDYNTQLGSGNLYRQALEYNDNLEKQVEEFNRGTNQFNASAYNQLSQFNASAKNSANQANVQARLNAAREKMDADAGWYNSLYGNISGLFKGLSDLGREAKEENWRTWYINKIGLPMGDDKYTRKEFTHTKKSGGKVKRKKGLTY